MSLEKTEHFDRPLKLTVNHLLQENRSNQPERGVFCFEGLESVESEVLPHEANARTDLDNENNNDLLQAIAQLNG